MVRLIIAERARIKGDYFTEVSSENLTDTGIGQIIFEAKRLIDDLEELHAKLNEDDE